MAAPGRTLLSCLIWALLLPIVREADASSVKTIVLLDVEGEKTPRLRKSLERMVKTQHKILVASVYRDAARRLRAEKLTPNNVKKVCAYLQAEGIVDGIVVAEDGRYKLIVRLRSGADGTITKKIPLRINQPSLSEEIAGQVEERLLGAIDVLPGLDGRVDDEAVATESRKKAGRAAAAKPAKKGKAEFLEDEDGDEEVAVATAGTGRGKTAAGKRGKTAARDDAARRNATRDDPEVAEELKPDEKPEEETPEEETPEESSDQTDEAESRRTAMAESDDTDDEPAATAETSVAPLAGPTNPRTAPVLLHAGASVVGRNLSFDHSGEADDAPRGYAGTPVPGAYVTGEIYPLAFGGRRGPMASVGIGFVADRVIKLESAIDDGMGGIVNLPTRQWRYGASLRYRHNFGAGPDGVSVHAGVGYNRSGFAISQSDVPATAVLDVPNVHYTYVDPGLGARVPITGPLAFLVEAKFLAPLDTGQIQTADHYGLATVKGYEGDAGFEYRVGERFLARAGARLMLMSYEFEGSGALTDRDANGETDVTGASDRYLGGYLTGGYAF